MMRVLRVSITVAMCVSALPSPALAQDDAFKQGLEARDDKKWSEVVRLMRVAIQADPQESTRKVRSNVVARLFGAQGMEYLPHYFIAEALKNQQDCAGAVTEWAISEQQTAVQSKPSFVAAIKRGYAECAAKGVLPPAEFNPLLAATRQAYVDANALAKRIVDLGAAHSDSWPSVASQYGRAHSELETASVRLTSAMRTRSANDFNEAKAATERANLLLKPLEASLNAAIESVASLQLKIRDVEQAIAGADATDKAVDGVTGSLTEPMAVARKSGRQQLSQARDRLSAGQTSRSAATVGEALKYAQSAAVVFNQVLEQARRLARSSFEQRFSGAVRAADEAFATASAMMTAFDKRVEQKPDAITLEMTAQRDALQKKIDAQRRQFERIRKSEDLAAVISVTKQTVEAQAALNTLVQALGPLTLRDRGVHAALEQAAHLFLAGDYQKALVALDPSTGVGDAPLQLHVHLFRAASLYGLFVRSGETRKELRTEALAEIELCKQISPTFQPESRVFAPRFIALYKTGQ